MKRNPFYVGIDISKDKFDVCIIHLPDGCGSERKIASKVFLNNKATFAEFLLWIEIHVPEEFRATLYYSMEATGVYHEHLAMYLHQKQNNVQVILPNLTANYAKTKNIRSKTDKIDAYLIALYSSVNPLRRWVPISDEFIELRGLLRQRVAYSRMIAELKCLIHSRKHSAFRSEKDVERYEESIKQHKKTIKAIEEESQKIINRSPKLIRMMDILMSHSYVAFVTAATLVAETNGFALFKSSRQLSSYVGFDVIQHSSGTSVKKPGKISNLGNTYIRRVMFLCGRSNKNSHPEYSKMTKRIMTGTTIKGKATVAVSRKILTVLFAMIQQDREYDPSYDWNKEQKARLKTLAASNKSETAASGT